MKTKILLAALFAVIATSAFGQQVSRDTDMKSKPGTSVVKINLAHLILGISFHYERQTSEIASIHLGLYYCDYVDFGSEYSSAGINGNYRLYFNQRGGIFGLYFGFGANCHLNIKGTEELVRWSLRPTVGYQILGKTMVFDIGVGMNFGIPEGGLPVLMMGIGFRLK